LLTAVAACAASVEVVKTVQQVLVCTLLAASTAAAVGAFRLLQAARTAVTAIPGEIRATRMAVAAEVEATRVDLSSQIGAARREALAGAERQATALRVEALAEVGEIRKTADRRIGDTLGRVDAALAKIDEVRGDLRPVLVNSAALAADAKDSWDDLYWDVKASVASATVAANNFGQMSQDIRGAVPPTVATWNGIGGNVQSITANINRLTKPHWYDRLLGYGLNGVILYRNLNPATNLTMRGAQTISGRP
jgi:hypothetical protein